jgi:hypothetical protein
MESKKPMGIGKQDLTLRGHLDLLSGSVEQRDPESAFQSLDLLADCRLGDEKFSRRPSETPGRRHLMEGFDLIDIHKIGLSIT